MHARSPGFIDRRSLPVRTPPVTNGVVEQRLEDFESQSDPSLAQSSPDDYCLNASFRKKYRRRYHRSGMGGAPTVVTAVSNCST
jgi:hypothetical protein